MSQYKFVITGYIPPKQSVRANKGGWNYQPAKIVEATNNFVSQLEFQAREQFDAIITSPIIVDIKVFITIPKSIKERIKSGSIQEESLLNHQLVVPVEPDIDNLMKFVLDAMKNTIISDDARIVGGTLNKYYTLGEPWVSITVSDIESKYYLDFQIKDKQKRRNVKSKLQRNPKPRHISIFNSLVDFAVEKGINIDDLYNRRYLKPIYYKKYISKILYDDRVKCPYLDIAYMFGDKDHQPVKVRIDSLNEILKYHKEYNNNQVIYDEFQEMLEYYNQLSENI